MHTPTPTPRLEGLEPRLLLSVADPLVEGAYSLLNVPARGALSVEAAAGADAAAGFRVTAPATGRLTLLACAIDPTVDPALAVYDPDGRLLAANDDVRRTSTDSLIRLRVQAGQVLDVLAQTPRAGRYRLTVISEPADDVGDTIDTAAAMALDGRGGARRSGRIDYPGDVDMLALTAQTTGQMRVTMTGLTGLSASTAPLTVIDQAGQRLGAPADPPGTELTFDVVAGQTYYIQASGDAETRGDYRIVATIEDPEPRPPATGDQDPLPVDPQDPQPGGQITAEARTVNGLAELFIAGTDADDVLTLWQADGLITLSAGNDLRVFAGAFARIRIQTWGGADVVRLAPSLSMAAHVETGEGDDTIYSAVLGGAWLDGGAGNDLIVSVGTAADRLIGGEGLDSFWMDGLDTLTDASAAERAIGAVHRIVGFEQPYTRDAASSQYVPMTPAGQSLPDPSITSAAWGYASFDGLPLFVDGPQYDDIEQGGIGDCYYLASLAAFADARPQLVRQMIAPLGDGTFAVRFYRDGREFYYRLDADLPVAGGAGLAYAGLGPDGELWVPLMEKAYAFFRYGQNSYASLEGGWMTTVYRELTNAASASWWTSGKTAAQAYATLSENLSGGYAVTAGSRAGGAGPIVSSHAYTVLSAETVNGQMFVTIYNPWSIDGRAHDDKPYDGLLRLSIDQFLAGFTTVAVSYA